MGKQWGSAHCRNNWRPSFFWNSVWFAVRFLEAGQAPIRLSFGALPPLLPTHSSPLYPMSLISIPSSSPSFQSCWFEFLSWPWSQSCLSAGKAHIPTSSTPPERWVLLPNNFKLEILNPWFSLNLPSQSWVLSISAPLAKFISNSLLIYVLHLTEDFFLKYFEVCVIYGRNFTYL